MFEKVIRNAGNVLHDMLIPVVRAQETQTNQSTDESLWNRLKATTQTT